MTSSVDSGSFRDPLGFVFHLGGEVYRQIQVAAKVDYDLLMSSGLYSDLVESRKLIPHFECDLALAISPDAYRVIQPERVPFISYPYEWCFSQLKDAALLTLSIQKSAIEFGMTLKDASAYNVQFIHGKPIFIDTLSFEKYEPGTPWVAYRQFCQHFLAPLALMCRTDIRLSQLFRVYIDGIPLDLASKLLPASTKFKFGLLSHIHLHSTAQKKFEKTTNVSVKRRPLPVNAIRGLIDSLESTVQGLKWNPSGTEWGNYYDETNYSSVAMHGKLTTVRQMLESITPMPRMLWDLGANRGVFSRIGSEIGISSVAWDIDPVAVEKNYLDIKEGSQENLLPLIQDLTNPSPDIGWSLVERKSMIHRGPADVVLALALIHHLCIGNNVPLRMVAEFFRSCGDRLIIEFVPKGDSQVVRLFSTREDVFPHYDRPGFETAFSEFFEIVQIENVQDSQRHLYLMKGC